MVGSITMAVAGLQPRSAVTRANRRGSVHGSSAKECGNKKTAPEGGFLLMH
jgi:hypothetical protein